MKPAAKSTRSISSGMRNAMRSRMRRDTKRRKRCRRRLEPFLSDFTSGRTWRAMHQEGSSRNAFSGTHTVAPGMRARTCLRHASSISWSPRLANPSTSISTLNARGFGGRGGRSAGALAKSPVSRRARFRLFLRASSSCAVFTASNDSSRTAKEARQASNARAPRSVRTSTVETPFGSSAPGT